VALAPLAEERKVRVHVRESAQEAAAGGTGVSPVGGRPVAPSVCVVVADAAQLRIALTCLVRNAIEAAGPDGWAVVRLGPQQPGQVEVVVEDSGPELPPAQRNHLFDPFFSGRSAGRGAGLALPTAWSLARQQGGDVFLASQPGEPTRFVLRLPSSDRCVCVPLAG
jgi:signal transduction histidine kinase